MAEKELILIETLCLHYEVEVSFFNALDNIGLIKIETIDQQIFIHQDKISKLEKMIRLHHELNVNVEGIDVVFNLLQKVDKLQSELNALNNRLKLYEND